MTTNFVARISQDDFPRRNRGSLLRPLSYPSSFFLLGQYCCSFAVEEAVADVKNSLSLVRLDTWFFSLVLFNLLSVHPSSLLVSPRQNAHEILELRQIMKSSIILITSLIATAVAGRQPFGQSRRSHARRQDMVLVSTGTMSLPTDIASASTVESSSSHR